MREREGLRAVAWTAAAFAGGLLLHVDRLPLWASAAAFVCLAWRVLSATGHVRLPRRYALILLTLCLCAAVFTQFKTLNGLNAGTALLAVMGSIKLLETKSKRDRAIAIGAAFFMLLAACLDRQTLLRAPLYLLEAWLCCTALAVVAYDGTHLNNRGAVTLAGRNLLYATPLAVLLFVFFPRLAGGFWALPQDTDATTGLSDTMSPGSISTLSESSEAAFRVRFNGAPPPPEERYWRGPVLHDFDGYTWRRVPGRVYRQQALEYRGLPYVYRVTLEPSSTRWWFALDLPLQSPDPKVFYTFDYQLLASEPVTQSVSYEATSFTHTRSTEPLSSLARRYDTALPPGRNPRSAALALQMRASAGSDAEYVDNVLTVFRSRGFEYTLSPPLLNYNSIDDFLFNTRKGFCGHFASAFVDLMRAAGVPARVVTGYQGGEWNPIGGYYIVRQSDAHAWAEVWLDGRGWARVDPTAVVAPERLRRGLFDLLPGAASTPTRLLHEFPWLRDALQRWDALNSWWNEYVLRFDFAKQLNLLRDLGIDSPDWQHLGWAFTGGLILWLVWIAWHIGRRTKPAPPDRLAQAYARLCNKLARVQLPRAPYLGPLAYADAISTQRPELASTVRPLLTSYAQLRYDPVNAETRAHLTSYFERGVSQLRPKRAALFPAHWRTVLKNSLPLYRKMPLELRARLEPLTLKFLKRMDFVGCQGLEITDEMRIIVATQACLLVAERGIDAYTGLYSVLMYPDEFVVERADVDEAGVVTEGTDVLSGQTIDTARIVLSWRDVQEAGTEGEAYNVVLHEFAHYLDHSFDGAVTETGNSNSPWHAVLENEYAALCAAVDRDEPTLIDPYGAEDLAEFFAVATETFFEQPQEMQQRHAALYAQLKTFYGLDPASWS